MKAGILRWLFLAAFCTASAGASGAMQVRVAYVNLDEIYENYDAYRGGDENVSKLLDEKQKKIQEEIHAQEERIKQLEQELDRYKDQLDSMEIRQRQAVIELRRQQLTDLIKAKEQEFEAFKQESYKTVNSTIMKAIKKVALAKGISIILNSADIIWAREDLDITKDVLDRIKKDVEEERTRVKTGGPPPREEDLIEDDEAPRRPPPQEDTNEARRPREAD